MNFMRNIKWVCHHAHLDKSQVINKELLQKSNRHMQEKWFLMKDIKEKYKRDELFSRINKSISILARQNCFNIRTFVDIDNVVGMMCVEETLRAKVSWRKFGINLQIATQPLDGLAGNVRNIKLFEEAAEICDIVGCLPSRDYDKAEEHLDIAFSTAKRLNKPVEAHLDQCNIPSETETEVFCNFVEKYDMSGRARSVHSVSLACHSLEYQKYIASRLSSLDIGVIICPSAAISMTQHSECTAPIHNSIAPLRILLDAGVNIGLGVDNINDIFMPLCDGNMEFELRLLAESTRIYDLDLLKKIAENTMGF